MSIKNLLVPDPADNSDLNLNINDLNVNGDIETNYTTLPATVSLGTSSVNVNVLFSRVGKIIMAAFPTMTFLGQSQSTSSINVSFQNGLPLQWQCNSSIDDCQAGSSNIYVQSGGAGSYLQLLNSITNNNQMSMRINNGALFSNFVNQFLLGPVFIYPGN
jgi:hypothetical protein